jgi:hypothetical protein
VEQLVVGIGEKVGVFEITQQTQIDDKAVCQQQFSFDGVGTFENGFGNEIFIGDGEQQQPKKQS